MIGIDFILSCGRIFISFAQYVHRHIENTRAAWIPSRFSRVTSHDALEIVEKKMAKCNDEISIEKMYI